MAKSQVKPSKGARICNSDALRKFISPFGRQVDFAKTANVSRRVLTKLLNDDIPTAADYTFAAIARTLGVGIDDITKGFYDGDDDDGNPIVLPIEADAVLKEMWPGLGGEGNLVDGFARMITRQKDSLTTIEEWDEQVPDSDEPTPIQHVRDFWESERIGGELVCIQGTISTFAPFVIGRPTGKRMLHHAYREMQEAGHVYQQFVQSNMTVTAGQMVWKLDAIGTLSQVWYCLGFYHSIVRNSVPIYVTEQVYRTQIEPHLCGNRLFALEAEIIGRVAPIAGFADAIDMKEWRNYIDPEELGTKSFGIFVTEKYGTRVNVIGDSRYLDGDIFFLVRADGNLRLATRFLDLSNTTDVRNEVVTLESEISKKNWEIQYRFDDLEKLKNENSVYSISAKDTIVQESRAKIWRDMLDRIQSVSSLYFYPGTDDGVDKALAVQDRDKVSREQALLRTMIPKNWIVTVELGCGMGRNFRILDDPSPISQKRLIVGIEPDASRAKQSEVVARELQYIETKVINGDVGVLTKLPENDADVALCVQVVGHVATGELERIINQLFSTLRSGGRLILCIPVVGPAFSGEPGTEKWNGQDDYFHLVNLRKNPFTAGFRQQLSRTEFNKMVSNSTDNQLLPVRSFFIDEMPPDANSVPFAVGATPRAIAELTVDRFVLTESIVYSVHRLQPDSDVAAVADLMLVYHKV